jgi:Vitamin K-dependent gamma-carboxylase
MNHVTVSHNPAPGWNAPLWLMKLFAIDVRGLAALRISFAGVLLYDAIVRAFSLTAHYTDYGILTRADRLNLEWDFNEAWWMSLHMLSGSSLWAGCLTICTIVSALCLLVGYRTKVALVCSWLLLYSIQARFPLLMQGGDVLLRCGLVWMFFLPLDGAWSWSAKREPAPSREIVCWGSAALLMQLLVMYFFSALLKTSPVWTENFHATYFALKIDHFTSPLGYRLAEYPQLLQWFTAITLQLELWGPLCMFIPWQHKFWRWTIPLTFIGFHLGLVACLDLGTFPWICILYWTTFLPAEFWNGVEQLVARYTPRTISSVLPTESNQAVDVPVFYESRELNAVAAFLLAYMLLLNSQRLQHPLATVGKPPLSLIGKVIGLNQYWNMFAPAPYQYSSWLRVEGELADGSLVNLYAPSQPLDDEKPAYVSGGYANQYWRRCMVMAFEFGEKPHQAGIVRYFRDRWNATHAADQQLVAARLVLMQQTVPLPTQKTFPLQSYERQELSVWTAKSALAAR